MLGDFEDDIVELFGDGLSQDDIIDELCYSISGKGMQLIAETSLLLQHMIYLFPRLL